MGMTLRLALALAAGGAAAEPAYFTAPNHAVAVRDAPGGAAVAEIAPGSGPIETTGAEGLWVRVPLAESDGWAARDALIPAEPARIEGTPIPDGLLCSGTEPFWSLRLSSAEIAYAAPGVEPEPFGLLEAVPAEGAAAWPLRVMLYGDARSGVAILRPLACADGMSDRTQPWTLDFLIQEEGALRLRSGCCRLPPAP